MVCSTLPRWSRHTTRPTQQAIARIAVGYGDEQTWTLGLIFFENVLVARMGSKWYQDLFREPKAGDPFSPEMTSALEDFRKVMSYANDDAAGYSGDEAMDRVMTGKAAMTIMGDWGKGFANAALGPERQPAGYYADKIGFMPMPGTAGTFMFTTDTFGMPKGARHPEEAQKLLTAFGSPEGQRTFNRLKGIHLRPPGPRDRRGRRTAARPMTTSSSPPTPRRSLPRRPFSPRGPTSTRSAPCSAPSRARAPTGPSAKCNRRWTIMPT